MTYHFVTTLLLIAARPVSALTREEIVTLDGHIIVGNRIGGKIQIFNSSQSEWKEPLWEYDTKAGKDGLRAMFDFINDVKRVRHNNTEHVLIAGNGPGIALFNLHTERFDFSYQIEVPRGSSCSMKSVSVHAAEMLPDGNFAVADPTGSGRGGNSLRLIYGDNDAPVVLQSISFSGIHAVVWDHKRKRLWAWGGGLRKYRYVSAGRSSALIQDGAKYKPPWWGSVGHDMMPMFREGQPDRLIFNCKEGVLVFHIETETFELLYGSISAATNVVPGADVRRKKGIDHNSATGEVIINGYETNSVKSPGVVINGTMAERSFSPRTKMEIYKAHWFQHNSFSYGPPTLTQFLQPRTFSIGFDSPSNRAPSFPEHTITKPEATVGEKYYKVFRGGAMDPDGDSLQFRKVCGPSWATVSLKGTIRGTPRKRDVGENRIILRVSDPGGLSDVATFEFDVQEAPTPTLKPTRQPSALPTAVPSNIPSRPPFATPSTSSPPSEAPTENPTEVQEAPMQVPTQKPTRQPSALPSATPSTRSPPSEAPTENPTVVLADNSTSAPLMHSMPGTWTIMRKKSNPDFVL